MTQAKAIGDNYNNMAVASHISRKEFEAIFPLLLEDIAQAAKDYDIPAVALEWFRKVRNLLISVVCAL